MTMNPLTAADGTTEEPLEDLPPLQARDDDAPRPQARIDHSKSLPIVRNRA